MPSVTYNGQSFAIDGRRIWILGASLQYTRIPAALWRSRIAAARQAGFNTIETAAVWSVHEPRKGRFVFDEQADIRKFIELCAAEGLRAILRIGPFIGGDFDSGGLPGWLVDMPGVALREANETFLEHVSRYFRKLIGEVSDLQATGGGSLILVQGEHAWTCSNQAQADRYLHELTRFIRESGVTVPVINANDLWQESPGSIDTWRGHQHMLFQVRQLRTVQPTAPRLVSEFIASRSGVWGGEVAPRGKGRTDVNAEDFSAATTLQQLAEVLAAGGQAVVSPFHGGTNFGFLGGRRPGPRGGFTLTSAGGDAPLGEAGERGEKFALLKRLVTFANHFSGLFTELDPEYQPIALDPHEALPGGALRGGASVVSVRGSQGRGVFVFGQPGDQSITLVLDNGLRLPVTLGDQCVTWTALDADLQGAGRLEYCNICPWAVVDRSIAVFHGPAKSPVFMSIDGAPLETTVPADNAKPLVIDHHGLTVVILNREQIDATYINDTSVYVGIAGIDVHGRPIPSPDWAKPWVISAGARLESLVVSAERAGRAGGRDGDRATPRIGDWRASPATAHVSGTSPRYASLEGPATLSDCGAPTGYGWYRARFNAGGRHLVLLPHAGDRLHLYLDGRAMRLVGFGPGAKAGAFEVKFDKGEHTLVALADNFGRFAHGNDLGRRAGLYGHVFSVKEIRGKAKIGPGKAVSPFELRGFLEGRSAEQLSDVTQAHWTFDHPRKTPVVIEVRSASVSGTFVLNDKPVAYFAGASGAMEDRIVLDPDEHKALKRGRNVLRFAPDHGAGLADELAGRVTLYEAVENLTEKADWAFAKWEPPAPPTKTSAKGARDDAAPARGTPCWWRAPVEVDAATAASERPLWLQMSGVSKGQAFINGHNLGRYFTATGDGKAVGPQGRLYLPTPWLKSGGGNDLVIFDEHGLEPHKVRIV